MNHRLTTMPTIIEGCGICRRPAWKKLNTNIHFRTPRTFSAAAHFRIAHAKSELAVLHGSFSSCIAFKGPLHLSNCGSRAKQEYVFFKSLSIPESLYSNSLQKVGRPPFLDLVSLSSVFTIGNIHSSTNSRNYSHRKDSYRAQALELNLPCCRKLDNSDLSS